MNSVKEQKEICGIQYGWWKGYPKRQEIKKTICEAVIWVVNKVRLMAKMYMYSISLLVG